MKNALQSRAAHDGVEDVDARFFRALNEPRLEILVKRFD
jgi:hypothetical protein